MFLITKVMFWSEVNTVWFNFSVLKSVSVEFILFHWIARLVEMLFCRDVERKIKDQFFLAFSKSLILIPLLVFSRILEEKVQNYGHIVSIYKVKVREREWDKEKLKETERMLHICLNTNTHKELSWIFRWEKKSEAKNSDRVKKH